MGLSVIAVAACIVQALLFLRMWQRERARRATSLSLYLVGALSLYHGATVLLGAWSDKYRAYYFGVTGADSDMAHVAATAMIAAVVLGHGLARRRWAGIDAARIPMRDKAPGLFAAIWFSVLAATAVAITASAGIFNIRSGIGTGEAGFAQGVLYYMLYPLLCLSAATVAAALSSRGSAWGARVALIVAAVVAALSGRRLSIIVVSLTAFAAMPIIARRTLSRRFLAAGIGAIVLVGAWMVPFREFQASQRGAVVAEDASGQSSGFIQVVRQYVDFLVAPSTKGFLEEAATDMSGRTDGHAFLAQVLAGQESRGGPLLGACVLGGLRFAVPSVLWPEKTESGLRYCKSTAVTEYSLPPVDFTPTLLGETTADLGPLLATLFFLLLGVVMERLDAWLHRRSYLTRAMVLATLGQAILTAESSWLGLALSARTLILVWGATWMARRVVTILWGARANTAGQVQHTGGHR